MTRTSAGRGAWTQRRRRLVALVLVLGMIVAAAASVISMVLG
jgi:hypothetical protein